MSKKSIGMVRVGAAVPRVHVANPAANALEIIRCIDDAHEKGAGFVVFPELCLTGCTCGDLLKQNNLYQQQISALSVILESSTGRSMCVILGMALRIRGRLVNGSLLIQDGQLKGFTPKDFIEGESEEAVVMEEAIACGALTFADDHNGICVGMEGFELCGVGAQIIFDTSHDGYAKVEGATYRRKWVEVVSSENACGYVYVTPGTGESPTDFLYSGYAFIAECGNVLAEDAGFRREAQITYSEIDLDKIQFARADWLDFGEADTVLLDPIPMVDATKPLMRKYTKQPFIPADPALLHAHCKEIFSIQSAALAKRLEHVGAKKVILGISGGLDSSLALLVSMEALQLLGKPREDLIAITMPGFGTSDCTFDAALAIVDYVGATLRKIPIGPAVLKHFEDIGHDSEIRNVTYENAQARERTQILLDVGNNEDGLVVGTGDLSEIALGWCTFNGDHMSNYGVNAGVPKTLIPHILRWVANNRKLGVDGTTPATLLKVVDVICNNPISPELLPPDADGNISQKTEEKVGPYALHEFFLYHTIRSGMSPQKLLLIATNSFADEYDKEFIKGWLKIFYHRFFTQQFKRNCSTEGPKVGSVGLSPRGDWAMPSDAEADAWLSELE
jgi:NAD+ synthase (glutamine-hydrolysing)